MDDFFIEEEKRREKREKRIAEMKRNKRRQKRMRRMLRQYGIVGAGMVCVAVLLAVAISMFASLEKEGHQESASTETKEAEEVNAKARMAVYESAEPEDEIQKALETDNSEAAAWEMPPSLAEVEAEMGILETVDKSLYGMGDSAFSGYKAAFNENTETIYDENVYSTYAILVDMEAGEVIAQKEAKKKISPASMTKILTVLVAAEHIADVNEKVTVTIDDTDYSYSNDCSAVGFAENEVVTVQDLMYGTILASGGDAASALAKHVAGSREAFAELMNEKLKELGLSETAHFTNCVGLYDEDHYCTVYDMAMILKAAAENDLCKEVLNAHVYTTSATEEHPDGITISNWFLRRIEDKDTHGEVLYAKTGFVNQSGNCAASYSVSGDGRHYICVTGNAHSSWRCIYDHVEIYQKYLKG